LKIESSIFLKINITIASLFKNRRITGEFEYMKRFDATTIFQTKNGLNAFFSARKMCCQVDHVRLFSFCSIIFAL